MGGRYRILAREQTPNGYVWNISDEVTIDENNPIAQVDLQLPQGRDLPIKVIDEAGQPISGQVIELEVAFRLKSDANSGFSFGINSETDSNGIALFRGLSADQSLGPVVARLTAIAKANPFVGSTTAIKSGNPLEIRLKKGLVVRGVLIDTKTNRPIPDADLRIVPRDFDQARFNHQITAKSDARGQFQFGGLEPIAYTGYVEGASPKGTVVEQLAPQSYRFHYPAGVQQLSLSAEDPQPIRWEVVIHPNGKLNPLE
jgi:hypothetical protein